MHAGKSTWHHLLHVGRRRSAQESLETPIHRQNTPSLCLESWPQGSRFKGLWRPHKLKLRRIVLRQSHALPWGPLTFLLISAGKRGCLGPESSKPLLICPEAQPSSHRCAQHPSNEPLSRTGEQPWAPSLTFLFSLVHKSPTPHQLCGVCLLGHPEPAQKKSLLIIAARCQRLLLLPCSDQQHSNLSPFISHGIKATK